MPGSGRSDGAERREARERDLMRELDEVTGRKSGDERGPRHSSPDEEGDEPDGAERRLSEEERR